MKHGHPGSTGPLKPGCKAEPSRDNQGFKCMRSVLCSNFSTSTIYPDSFSLCWAELGFAFDNRGGTLSSFINVQHVLGRVVHAEGEYVVIAAKTASPDSKLLWRVDVHQCEEVGVRPIWELCGLGGKCFESNHMLPVYGCCARWPKSSFVNISSRKWLQHWETLSADWKQ